ncbi:MAG: hypothetical protein J6N49_06785 [Alphaproteobacteria bacterium]|nr:hypothetical protein [Alphaproteobacteria bacterium]
MNAKIKKALRADVHVETSHLWIIYLGVVVALGFLVDCVIAPIWHEYCRVIDYSELITSAGIIAGLEAVRKYALTNFKYLKNLTDVKPAEGTTPKKNSPEEILKEKLWVPCVGWFLVLGYAVNILLIPFIDGINEVDWNFLHASVSIFLTISGLREYGVYSKTEKELEKENAGNAEQ